jgi:hypothetical protein
VHASARIGGEKGAKGAHSLKIMIKRMRPTQPKIAIAHVMPRIGNGNEIPNAIKASSAARVCRKIR